MWGIDIDRGLLYRASSFARATKKKRPPVKIPRQLRGHLRRWERLSRQYVIEFSCAPSCGNVDRSYRDPATSEDAFGVPHTLQFVER